MGRDHPLGRCISMLISRSLIIAFVLISLGCISSQGAALGADDRRTNDITCYDFCRATNFKRSYKCWVEEERVEKVEAGSSRQKAGEDQNGLHDWIPIVGDKRLLPSDKQSCSPH